MDHPTEPHTHRLSFADEAGEEFEIAIDCPGTNQELHDAIKATGVDLVNHLALDGEIVSFERAFDMLGQCGLVDMLGTSYRTTENLVKVFAAMGAGSTDA